MKHVNKIKKLPIKGKYFFISDFHMGIGDGADDMAHSQHIDFYLLNRCLENNIHVVMLGDIFEAAENKSIEPIKNAHDDIMWVLGELDKKGLLTYVRGNHDAYVKEADLRKRTHQYDGQEVDFLSLDIYDGLEIGDKYLCVHGHQTQWKYTTNLVNHIINWLLRVGWHRLQYRMCKDPSSDIQGWQAASKVDKALNKIGQDENKIIIAGHTHKCKKMSNYINIGSFAVLPRTVTYGYMEDGEMKIMKCNYVVDSKRNVKITEKEITIGE